jgi:NAD(P)-dependent dehydrogenase (short-subunit alcohol dehydrogenase family)
VRILLIGGAGTLGTAVRTTVEARGHHVLTAGRSSGDLRYDISDPAQVRELYDQAGPVDAVVSAVGKVPYKPVSELAPEDYLSAFREKVLNQIDLVRQGIPRVAERGSFTLTTGVLAREPIVTGAAASMANGALEAFVRAAAVEIAPLRINAVSPTVFTESLDHYGSSFPGMPSVDLAVVVQAFVRAVEGPQTGRVLIP